MAIPNFRWQEIIDSTLYSYTPSIDNSVECCKFTWDKTRRGFSRKVYILRKDTCTCLGYIKVGNCKHLQMYNDEFNFLSDVSNSDMDMGEYVGKVIRFIKREYPDNEKLRIVDRPKKFNAIQIEFNIGLRQEEISKICYVKKFSRSRKLGISLLVTNDMRED